MLRVLGLCLIAVVYTQAMTTTSIPTTKHVHHGHHTHSNTTREPNEHELFRFSYVPPHDMMLITGKTCYVFALSDSERVAVHTDVGMKTLELKLLGLLDTGAQTPTTKDQLSHAAQHGCGGHVEQYFTVV